MSAAGGIERVIARHIEFMSEVHQVILLTKDNSLSFFPLPEGIERAYLNIDFKMDMRSRWKRILKVAWSLFWTISALKHHFREHKPDVVYVASPLNLLEVWLARMNCHQVIVTEHSSFSAYNRIYKLIVALLYPRVGLLTVPTRLDCEIYRDKGIRNVYLPNPLSFYPERAADLTEKSVLCVGRLTEDKRHDLLLDIWHDADLQPLGWKLKIIGKGENELLLREKIFALGLSESVDICMPTLEIQEAIMASSIFLLTSRAEGFGLVLTEAMACGVPCICFDCPSGPRDIVEDGVTGCLLNEGDVKGFVASLRTLALESKQREEFGAQSRLAVQKFRAEKVGEKFRNLLEETFFYAQSG